MTPIRRFVTAWYALIGLVCATIAYLMIPLAFDRGLRVYFFDIGQGDAAYIRTADHRNILIDGGPDNTILYRLGPLLPWYDRTIDAILLTHPHADHMVGLIEVLRRYQVRYIIITAATSESAYAKAWQQAIAQEDAQIITLTQPQTIMFGKATPFVVLFPDGKENLASERELNNTSIVGRLTYGTIDILFTGDYEHEELLASNPNVKAEIIKVGHHGSHNATSEAFVQSVDPDYAIISLGAGNRYGHPHTEAIALWQSIGAQLLRTDCNGTMRLYSDGNTFSLTPQRQCSEGLEK